MGIGEDMERSLVKPNESVMLSVLWVWFDSAWMIDGIYHRGDQAGEDLETAVNQCKTIGRPCKIVRLSIEAPRTPEEATQ